MSGYRGCKFCGGYGCIACPGEQKKAGQAMQGDDTEPIFTADPNNPGDMDLLKSILGRDAIEFAFDPTADPMDRVLTGRGGGVRTIMQNAALARLLQRLHKAEQDSAGDTSETPGGAK